MGELHFIAERKIREGMRDGAFEQLDGEGAPLDLEENPFEDPAQRMALRVLRNNGFAPAWIEEGKDIDADVARLAKSSADERRRLVPELNRRDRCR